MRVLLIGSLYPDSFVDNTLSSLRDGGHVVRSVALFSGALLRRGPLGIRLQREAQAVPRLTLLLQRGVLEAAEDFRPELVLVLDDRLAHTTLAALRSACDAPVAFWYPDSPGNLGREVHVLGGYDALFLKDSAIVGRYRRTLSLNAHFLPEACNPRWHRPVGGLAPPQLEPEVLVAGNVYATRFVLMRALAARGVRLRIFGPRWARWLPRDASLQASNRGRYLVREDKAREFRAAPVVLNSLASHEGDGLNCRLFEATACGAIVLTEWRDRLPDLYDVPGEVSSYRSLDELVQLARELARMDASRREAISLAASRRAHTEHTYQHRFATIVSVLGSG